MPDAKQAVPAAPHQNPDQPTIDAINDRKALIDAQEALIKAQISLIKEAYPAFGDDFGKKGTLSIESAERDKFHVTAKSAAAFEEMAAKLANLIKPEFTKRPIVMLVDMDRAAVNAFQTESTALDTIESKVLALFPAPAVAKILALSTAVFGVGTVLSQIAQFTQLFRTDKNVAFTDALLEDEVLLDLVAVALPAESVKYPSGEIDRFLSKEWQSDFGSRLSTLLSKRSSLLAITDPAKDVLVKEALADMTALSTRLAAPDATTKLPELFTVLRGELVKNYLSLPEVLTLSIKVVSKGGASLKTSSIWRSDRLYASGGVIVSYRLADTGASAKILQAGVLSVESGFDEIPLGSRQQAGWLPDWFRK